LSIRLDGQEVHDYHESNGELETNEAELITLSSDSDEFNVRLEQEK